MNYILSFFASMRNPIKTTQSICPSVCTHAKPLNLPSRYSLDLVEKSFKVMSNHLSYYLDLRTAT